jgi:hypothetical protein
VSPLARTQGGNLDLVLFAVLLAVMALLVAAHVTRLPYPILLTLGGMGIGFVPGIPDDGEIERRSIDYQHLVRELLRAQQDALVTLRNRGRISDEVLRRVQRELDLEDNRLDLDRPDERREALLDGGTPA